MRNLLRRGDMENDQGCQLDLYADRTSAQTMRANQLRCVRRDGLCADLCDAAHRSRRHRICQRHLRHIASSSQIGALVRISVRRIKIAMASACPAAEHWAAAPLG